MNNCFLSASSAFWKTENETSGCRLRELSTERVKSCLDHLQKENKKEIIIYYLGNSRMRQLFRESSYQLTGKVSQRYYFKSLGHFLQNEKSIVFEWGPGQAVQALKRIRGICRSRSVKCPMFIVTNLMLHIIKAKDFKTADETKYANRVKPFIDSLSKTAETGPIVIWQSVNPLMVTPVTKLGIPPRGRSHSRNGMFTPKNIAIFNKVAEDLISKYPNIRIWNNTADIIRHFDKLWSKGFVENYVHGPDIHFPPEVMEKQVTLLMNFICNKELSGNREISKSQLFEFNTTSQDSAFEERKKIERKKIQRTKKKQNKKSKKHKN